MTKCTTEVGCKFYMQTMSRQLKIKSEGRQKNWAKELNDVKFLSKLKNAGSGSF